MIVLAITGFMVTYYGNVLQVERHCVSRKVHGHVPTAKRDGFQSYFHTAIDGNRRVGDSGHEGHMAYGLNGRLRKLVLRVMTRRGGKSTTLDANNGPGNRHQELNRCLRFVRSHQPQHVPFFDVHRRLGGDFQHRVGTTPPRDRSPRPDRALEFQHSTAAVEVTVHLPQTGAAEATRF